MSFWDELTLGMHSEAASIDEHLGHRRTSTESIRNLADEVRKASGLSLPVAAGTRVAFRGNLGALLSYDSPPEAGAEGEVVMVRSASGDITAAEGLVFVKWDSGAFLPVHREHLRAANPIPQPSFSKRVASIGDLSDFMKAAGDDLIHKATKDLWSMRKEGDGFVIERLFKDTGAPLKV